MKTTCYLQVVPAFGKNGEVKSIKAARVGADRPRVPLPGAIVCRLRIEIPDKAFAPVDVTVSVPMRLLESPAKVRVEKGA